MRPTTVSAGPHPESPYSVVNKGRENRLRRAAKRQGLFLERSRRRNCASWNSRQCLVFAARRLYPCRKAPRPARGPDDDERRARPTDE